MPDLTTQPHPETPQKPEFNLEDHFATGESHLESNTEQIVEQAQERAHAERDKAYAKILQQAQGTQQSDDATLSDDASALHQKDDRDAQVQHLIDLASTKGLMHAVAVARHAEDYYVLDQLHDRLLAQDLHDALIANSMIEEL